MSKNNVRIAIRDSTDSHNVAFFDNKAGIKYKSANLHRFLAGSASILTIKYNSKDIDSIRSGCKLAFRYKNRDYWLNVMSFEKKGFEVELTAYSLGLELNNETRGEYKPANAMSITEYVTYCDPEHALTIGVNEVSDKRIKLEWTGTDTILARLFSVANSFGAELDFSVELNDDYSLKRQVLNIYKKGNLGTNKVSQPVRVGKELKVINYSDNIKELRTAVRATGKDGLTIDGLNKKIYDSNKQLLYYSSGDTVYAPQSRDRYPSISKNSNDSYIAEELGETQYETKEALWGYLYSEIQKKSVPEITYEVEGAIEAGIGDTQTLIDDIHFEPALYVQARVSELEDDILTGKVTKSTFINFERKYSQIADILLKQVEALAEDAAPYIIRLSTNNGYIFKNGEGSSTITARLEKYSKDIAATWKWVVDNKVVGTGDKLTVKAEQVTNTMAVTVIAYVNGNEVVRDYMTFSNSDDGVGVESIDRYFTSSDQSDGVTIEGAEWSDKPPAPTGDGKYLWAYDEITYTDGTVTTTKPAAVGANFDVDAFRAEIAEDLKDVPNREEFENKIAEELANSKAEIETQIETAKTQAESNAKEYADTINDETAKVAELANAAAGEIKADLVNVKNNLTSTSIVANNAQAAVDAAKQDLAEVASDLNTAKQDFADSVAAVNTKVDSTKVELTQAKQDLVSHAQQLQTQANAQSELTKRVSSVEKTADGTKTTVSELSKTVTQNGKDITSVTARTKTVEDDLAGTKTTLSQVKTTADSTSQKTATLETGLNGVKADLTATTTTANTTKQNLANYQASNDRAVANLQSNIQTANGDISSLKTKVEAVPGQITSAVSAVEGKIPTSSGGRNLAQKTSKDWSKPFTGFSGAENTGTSLYKVLTDGLVVGDTFKTRIILKYTNIVPASGKTAKIRLQGAGNVTGWGRGGYNFSPWKTISGSGEVVIEHEFKITADHLKNDYWDLAFRTDWIASGSLQWKLAKAERGMFFTDWSPAPEDTANQISNLSSEIQQTADGITLLATKTELNTAKNELQSGINTATNKANNNAQTISTHTTQISALNTGLQAKVSQTEFNTLSGRVTTAENNITAKANELSSKISSVESKIPTSLDSLNLMTGTRDWSTKANKWHMGGNWSTENEEYQGLKVHSTQIGHNGSHQNIFVKNGDVITFSFFAKATNTLSKIKVSSRWNGSSVYQGPSAGVRESDEHITITSEWKRYSKTIHITSDGSLQFRTEYEGSTIPNGNTFYVAGLKLAKSELDTGYSENPTDAASDISSLSSELKQTQNGITLLATKTELNSAKNELQSGIKTATDKANSNAQTISTHTTQISALNTGLQAKVSQSEFNTLSGRVTTAENNITAKANELSSKITSVEGKLPSGEMNLVEYGRPTDGYSPYAGAEYATHPFYYNGAYKMYIIKNTATSEKMLIMNRFKVERNTDYTLYFKGFNNGEITHMDVWFLKRVNGSENYYDSAQILVNSRKLSVARAEDISVTFNTGNYDEGFIRFDNNGSKAAGTRADLYFGDVSVKKGKSNNGWSPSLAELASSKDLKTAQSEFKQTTDSIKASVSSLDSSTVKSSSLTINADGIVMKAGKSTTDVANAIGSYFAVNQNAINLFSDKINVKGNMIVNGAITSDKIASKSINTAHLNGKIITADVISSNAVTASAIKAGAVTTDKMSANSINGDRIAAGTLDAAKIKAGSITASQIASGTITSAQIKTGTISAANIAAGAITADKIAANSISSDKIVSSGITADVISGGVLKAANDAMQINLNSSNITFSEDASVIFTSSDNALKRVITGKPSQFIKMCDSVFVSEIGELPDSTLTVIASNSDRTENIDSAGFGGMKIWNGSSSTDSTSFVELVGNRVAIYGNKNRSPWLFDMTTTTSSLIPQNSNGIKHSLGRGDRPFHSVYADNMYIQGERVAMMLKDIALYIGYKGNNGWVDRIS